MRINLSALYPELNWNFYQYGHLHSTILISNHFNHLMFLIHNLCRYLNQLYCKSCIDDLNRNLSNHLNLLDNLNRHFPYHFLDNLHRQLSYYLNFFDYFYRHLSDFLDNDLFQNLDRDLLGHLERHLFDYLDRDFDQYLPQRGFWLLR
jgi:hypothetical protein